MRLLAVKSGVPVTEYLWRCNCIIPWQYLHLKDETQCPRCGAYQDECPDATVEEFIQLWQIVEEERQYLDKKRRVK